LYGVRAGFRFARPMCYPNKQRPARSDKVQEVQ